MNQPERVDPADRERTGLLRAVIVSNGAALAVGAVFLGGLLGQDAHLVAGYLSLAYIAAALGFFGTMFWHLR